MKLFILVQCQEVACCPCWASLIMQIYRKFHLQNLKISDKKQKLIFFHISAQNIDCGYSLEPPRRGGSNEYPQSMFLSRNKKTDVYTPVNPQFYYIKVGFKGSKLYRHVFVMSRAVRLFDNQLVYSTISDFKLHLFNSSNYSSFSCESYFVYS